MFLPKSANNQKRIYQSSEIWEFKILQREKGELGKLVAHLIKVVPITEDSATLQLRALLLAVPFSTSKEDFWLSSCKSRNEGID